MGYTLKSLRWISHALTSELKQIRFDLCLQLPPKLCAQVHDDCRHLVMGDESWSDYEDVRDLIWTARDANTSEGENRPIASTKTMPMILWNPHGFQIVTMLPPGESFNASWFIDQNLIRLIQSFFPPSWSPRQKMMVAVDNAPAHSSRMTGKFSEHNPEKRLPHPPYSPDISPSDFYLFGKAEGALIGQEIPDEISLLDTMTEI
jgi:histone-lysine N-methyltransferase SETMAR